MYNYFKYLLFSLSLLVLLTTFTQCKDEAEIAEIKEELVNVMQEINETKLVEADNTFGWNIFQTVNDLQLDEDPTANVCISPFSMSVALSMLYNAANGQTKEDMRAAMELHDLDIDAMNAAYKSLLTRLSTADRSVVMNFANSIWPKLGYAVNPDFLETNRTFFDSEVIELDFSRSDAVDIINAWISDNTNGKIEDALDFVPPSVVMYIINAVYFNANWRYPFDPELTSEQPFHLYDGTTSTCEMMQMDEAAFPFYQNELFQAVDLAYGDSIFSMTILQPHENVDINELAAQITEQQWQEWTTNTFEYQNIMLRLPKFKTKYKIQEITKDALTGTGMGIIFNASADFSGIPADGLPGPFVSRVIHETFVEVNEEGTEAAAVTIIEVIETAPIVPMIHLNRPFLYVIRENQTGTVLFIGKMMNPAAS